MDYSQIDFILVHAGATEFDEQGRMTGNLDLPLSEEGEIQVRELAEELSPLQPRCILCASDLAAQQTAQAISSDGNTKVKVDDSFANLDVGLWHGKSIDELRETQPRLYRQWREHPENVTPPEGESIDSARNRVQKALKRIAKKHKGGTVLIVASHPLAAIIQAEILGAGLVEFWDEEIRCGTWCKLNASQVVSN